MTAIERYRNKHDKEPIITEKFLAEELAVDEGDIVKVGATEGTVTPGTAGVECIGVALNSVTLADIAAYQDTEGDHYLDEAKVEVDVMLQGIAPILAGGELAMDAWVASDANARGVTATIFTDACIGICMDAATGDGEETHILIHRIPIDART